MIKKDLFSGSHALYGILFAITCSGNAPEGTTWTPSPNLLWHNRGRARIIRLKPDALFGNSIYLAERPFYDPHRHRVKENPVESATKTLGIFRRLPRTCERILPWVLKERNL